MRTLCGLACRLRSDVAMETSRPESPPTLDNPDLCALSSRSDQPSGTHHVTSPDVTSDAGEQLAASRRRRPDGNQYFFTRGFTQANLPIFSDYFHFKRDPFRLVTWSSSPHYSTSQIVLGYYYNSDLEMISRGKPG